MFLDTFAELRLQVIRFYTFGEAVFQKGTSGPKLKQQGLSDEMIAKTLGRKINQVKKKWYELLALAWELRNRSGSGAGASSDE